jgi:hypothetical protein
VDYRLGYADLTEAITLLRRIRPIALAYHLYEVHPIE